MLDRTQIEAIIPHRDPFLLLDRIEELEPGKRAIGYKLLTGEEDFFRGHFPGQPVMPGVLIIEALAQTGAVAVLSLDEYKGKIVYFAGIDKAKFKKIVHPGDCLKFVVEITRLRGNFRLGDVVAYVGDEVEAQATITFAIQ